MLSSARHRPWTHRTMRLLREAGFVISKSHHLRKQITELGVWSSIRVVALVQGISRRGFPKSSTQ